VDQIDRITVSGVDGLLGWIDPSELAESDRQIFIHLPDGRRMLAPIEMLERRTDGSYALPLSRASFDPPTDRDAPTRGERSQEGKEWSETVAVMPLAVEEVHVGTRVNARPVSIRKRVHTRVKRIEDTGYREEVHVERAPINRLVKREPRIRTEGETTVIPLVEEVLVVEKRLYLREEVHITMRRIPNEPIEVELRAEELEVHRSDQVIEQFEKEE
jgi:stress response protein YsnF